MVFNMLRHGRLDLCRSLAKAGQRQYDCARSEFRWGRSRCRPACDFWSYAV